MDAIGRSIKMSYTIPILWDIGFALFNYATENIGGYVDFDYYRISDKMTELIIKEAENVVRRMKLSRKWL